MFRPFCLFVAVVFVLRGAVLLYWCIGSRDASQTVPVLAGAALFTFGFMTVLLIAKDWLDRIKRQRLVSRRWWR
jgi:hypothetical protein